jgi:hypothetical protein
MTPFTGFGSDSIKTVCGLSFILLLQLGVDSVDLGGPIYVGESWSSILTGRRRLFPRVTKTFYEGGPKKCQSINIYFLSVYHFEKQIVSTANTLLETKALPRMVKYIKYTIVQLAGKQPPTVFPRSFRLLLLLC